MRSSSFGAALDRCGMSWNALERLSQTGVSSTEICGGCTLCLQMIFGPNRYRSIVDVISLFVLVDKLLV